MATYCPKCIPQMNVCDFCKFYDFNGDKEGRYIERGYCRFHKEAREPGDGCDDFVCTHVKPRHA